MTTRHPLLDDTPDDRFDPDEAATWLLDLIAAVDHLRRGYRPRLTVWDALAEAFLLTTGDADDHTLRDAPDPLANSLQHILDTAEPPVAATMQTALRRWVLAMAAIYNNEQHWPHPTPRRGFPPPHLNAAPHDDPI